MQRPQEAGNNEMNRYKAKILVTAVGSGIGQSIVKSLKMANTNLGRNYKIYTGDAKSHAAGLYRGVKGFLIPPASSRQYLDFMINLCVKEGIQVLIPGCDPELPILAKNRSLFEKENILVIVSSPDAVEIGIDKWKTYKFLKENGFHYPLSTLGNDVEEFLRKVDFPLLVKPRMGSGSVGLNVVRNREELDFYVNNTEKPIIQEYLSSNDNEYTIGIVLSRSHTVLGSITMKRKLKKGATYFAIVEDFQEIRETAERIALATGLIGSINIQLKIVNNNPVVFEINPRFSGTTATRAHAGFHGVDAVIRHYYYNENIEKMNFRNLIMIRYLNEMIITPEDFEELNKNKCVDFKDCAFSVF